MLSVLLADSVAMIPDDFITHMMNDHRVSIQKVTFKKKAAPPPASSLL